MTTDYGAVATTVNTKATRREKRARRHFQAFLKVSQNLICLC